VYVHDDTIFGRNLFDDYVSPLEKDVLNNFNKLLKDAKDYFDGKGIKLFISFPPTPKTDKRKDLDKLTMSIFEKCGIKILGTPNDFRFDYDNFYNGSNHLNYIGAIKRSEILSDLIINKVIR
jgi:hypothetical protein